MEEIMIKVKNNKQECKLPMVVVKAETHPPLLFGRSWLQAIQLDWPTIFSQGQYSVQADVVNELKAKYANIFKQGGLAYQREYQAYQGKYLLCYVQQ